MSVDPRHYDVILSPVITEKATARPSTTRWSSASAMTRRSREIKAAVEKLFEVKVTGVNTLVARARRKRFRGTVGTPERRQAARS